MRQVILSLILGLTLSGCQHAPPTLSPAGVAAFQNHQVQRALDLIRDTAQDANSTVPPVLSTDTTRTVTEWHQSAITIVHAHGAGWQALITTSLDELSRNLPNGERPKLAPYISLAKILIAEAF